MLFAHLGCPNALSPPLRVMSRSRPPGDHSGPSFTLLAPKPHPFGFVLVTSTLRMTPSHSSVTLFSNNKVGALAKENPIGDLSFSSRFLVPVCLWIPKVSSLGRSPLPTLLHPTITSERSLRPRSSIAKSMRFRESDRL